MDIGLAGQEVIHKAYIIIYIYIWDAVAYVYIGPDLAYR